MAEEFGARAKAFVDRKVRLIKGELEAVEPLDSKAWSNKELLFLNSLLKEEKAKRNRKTVLRAIERKMEEFKPESLEGMATYYSQIVEEEEEEEVKFTYPKDIIIEEREKEA